MLIWSWSWPRSRCVFHCVERRGRWCVPVLSLSLSLHGLWSVSTRCTVYLWGGLEPTREAITSAPGRASRRSGMWCSEATLLILGLIMRCGYTASLFCVVFSLFIVTFCTSSYRFWGINQQLTAQRTCIFIVKIFYTFNDRLVVFLSMYGRGMGPKHWDCAHVYKPELSRSTKSVVQLTISWRSLTVCLVWQKEEPHLGFIWHAGTVRLKAPSFPSEWIFQCLQSFWKACCVFSQEQRSPMT